MPNSLPTALILYGEALGTDWLSPQAKIDAGHQHFVDNGWNKATALANHGEDAI